MIVKFPIVPNGAKKLLIKVNGNNPVVLTRGEWCILPTWGIHLLGQLPDRAEYRFLTKDDK